jgi:hypothetical protein
MRDFRDAKAMAQTLRDALKVKGVSLTHSDSLELVASILGFHDWNTLAARLQSERNPPDAGPTAGRISRQEIILDALILDRYVGFYLPQDNHVFTITRDGNRLLTRFTGQLGPVPFYPESDTEFFAKVINDQISFVTDVHGQVESLILHQLQQDWPMKRIDAATARQIEDKRAERMRSHSASPGTEAALRRFIDGLIVGEPNYDEMSFGLDEATRNQLKNWHADLAPLGAVQSIRFLGVGGQGEDVFVVQQERGEVRHWRIALDSNGTIYLAWVSTGL